MEWLSALARAGRQPWRPPKFLQKNFKVVAIAESFSLEDGYSVYAGVLARKDGTIEDVALALARLGGVDGTRAAMEILDALMKPDASMIMLDGCIVSFYNWIDGEALWKKYGKPVACYVFEEPEGRVEDAVRKLFSDWEVRLEAYRRLGQPTPYYTQSGYRIYIRSWGIDTTGAGRAAEACAKFGKVPEPLRSAKIIASGARRFLRGARAPAAG